MRRSCSRDCFVTKTRCGRRCSADARRRVLRPRRPLTLKPLTLQEIRLLVGCALGDLLRIRAPEVPYESDDTLKARAARERAARRAGAACRLGPDSSAISSCLAAQEVYRLLISSLRTLEEPPNSPLFERAAQLLSVVTKVRPHARARLHFARVARAGLFGSRARRRARRCSRARRSSALCRCWT